MARAAAASPWLYILLTMLAKYTVWGELAFVVVKLALASGLDAGVLEEDSMVGHVALWVLKDEMATLNEEVVKRGGPDSAKRGPSSPNGGASYRPVGAVANS